MFHVKHFNFKIYYYVVALFMILFIQLHKLNAKDSYFDKIIQDVVCYNKYNFYIMLYAAYIFNHCLLLYPYKSMYVIILCLQCTLLYTTIQSSLVTFQ